MHRHTPPLTLPGFLRARGARGYSLPFVILILVMLSIALASLLFVLTAGARSTESMLGRRRLFYACDGLSRLAAVSAQEYFGQTATPNDTDLRAFVCAQGGGCPAGGPQLPTLTSQTPGFEVSAFDIAQQGGRVLGQLDSGPFSGMNALVDTVSMSVTGRRASEGWVCNVEQEIALAKISMFQFFVFADQPYTDWLPGPKMAGDGRVHANGDLCFFALTDLFVDRATVAGRVSPGKFNGGTDGTICRAGSYNDFSPNKGPKIATVDTPVFDTNTGNSDPIEPDNAHFVTFANRPGSKGAWLAAAAVFNGHLMDSDHGVQPLRLPVLGTPTLQAGKNASNGDVTPNSGTRLLVDPMYGSDTDDVRAQKFAFKADIRIINGVWYLRDETNPSDIGLPIWSDHAANLTTAGESNVEVAGEAVGQATLASPAGRNWGAAIPKRFSYYRFGTGTSMLHAASDPAAVVSYGLLHRKSGTFPTWEPGFRCSPSSTILSALTGSCSGQSLGERLIRGTRSGLRDGHAQNRFGVTDERANVLPINIDLAALQNALADCTAGELGSYFPGTCAPGASGRVFNGVIYVTNTWPGSSSLTPSPPPQQGSRGGGSIAITVGGVSVGAEQVGLPEPICADVPGGTNIAGAIPFAGCAGYRGANIPNSGSLRGARPTAVRVFNGRNIHHIVPGAATSPTVPSVGRLDNGPGQVGLSVVTNLPLYVLGDMNRGSNGFGDASSTPWVPMLLAGDVITLLSNNWDDARANWSLNLGSTPRTPTETFYNTAILAGWTPTTTTDFSGGIHNFPRFMEDWDNVPVHIRGSIVIGWASVYTQWKRHCCNNTSYDAPDRDWGFDRHLANILNQPPGAPLFDVQATRRWKR